MISRRAFGTAILSVGVTAPSWASDSDDTPAQSLIRLAQAVRDPITLGHILPDPRDPVWAEAQGILKAAPRGATPFEVATYFASKVPPNFQSAWPEPDVTQPTLANPLIVLFFLSTKTKPAGDTTAWCAAFMNWCLQRSGITGSSDAGSQSFRDWGSPVWTAESSNMPTAARAGDVAVFRTRSDPAHGHVAFFKAIDPTQPRHVQVLGGNQITSRKLHVIDVKSLRTDGNLQLVSIRRKPGLQHA